MYTPKGCIMTCRWFASENIPGPLARTEDGALTCSSGNPVLQWNSGLQVPFLPGNGWLIYWKFGFGEQVNFRKGNVVVDLPSGYLT